MEKNKNREFCSPADPEKMFSNIQCLVFVVHFTVLSDRCFIVHFMYMDSRRTIGKWSAAFRQNMKDHRTSEFLWFIFEFFFVCISWNLSSGDENCVRPRVMMKTFWTEFKILILNKYKKKYIHCDATWFPYARILIHETRPEKIATLNLHSRSDCGQSI